MAAQSARKFLVTATACAAVSLFAADESRAAATDDPLLMMVILDEFELRDTDAGDTLSWDAQGWIGKDLNKFWFKVEGDRTGGDTDESELQFLYSKAVARYWDFQIGVRQDVEPSPSRSWAVIGFQGLAPYFFETDVAFFIGESGRTALRFESEYELLLTQRLIFRPQIEVNFYGKDDADIGIGSGLSDLEIGLRLRYEIRREFAPYIGVNWTKLYGNTADFAKIAGKDTSEAELLIGLRLWF